MTNGEKELLSEIKRSECWSRENAPAHVGYMPSMEKVATEVRRIGKQEAEFTYYRDEEGRFWYTSKYW